MSVTCSDCNRSTSASDKSWRTNPMDRSSVSEYSTRLWSFDEDVNFYANAGWGQIGVFLHKLEDPPFGSGMLLSQPLDMSVVHKAAKTIKASGLGVSHVCISGGWTDTANYERHANHTLWAMQATEILGGDLLIVAPGRLSGHSYEQAFDISVRAIREVLERSKTDVRLAIEPLRPWQLDFMNGFDEAIDLVHAVGSDRFGVWVDVWHLGLHADISKGIERHGGHIFGVELSDAPDLDPNGRVRLVPGDGVIPIQSIVAATIAAGFTGPFALELAPSSDSSESYSDDLRRSQLYFVELLGK